VQLASDPATVEEAWDELVKGNPPKHPPYALLIAKHATKWRTENQIKRQAFSEKMLIWFAIIECAKARQVTNHCAMGWFLRYQQMTGNSMWQMREWLESLNREVAKGMNAPPRASRKGKKEYGQKYALALIDAGVELKADGIPRGPTEISEADGCKEYLLTL